MFSEGAGLPCRSAWGPPIFSLQVSGASAVLPRFSFDRVCSCVGDGRLGELIFRDC